MRKLTKEDQSKISLPGGYKAVFVTNLFGKEYLWCTDPEGTWFLDPLMPND